MSLIDILKHETNSVFGATEELFKRCEGRDLSWKPSDGKNWMTIGQLMNHITTQCTGVAMRGFVTGEWGMPEGNPDNGDGSLESMLPPAEAMPSVESVAQALEGLAADKKIALDTLAQVREEDLLTHKCAAPWGGEELTLLQHLWHMNEHLRVHEAQLFYYLKLQGDDVNTAHLWGM